MKRVDKLEMVIKAWECCNPFNRRCFECPYEDNCFHDGFDRVAIADMVELLKSQKKEIENLKAENHAIKLNNAGLDEQRTAFALKIENQRQEINRLNELLKEQQPKKPVYDCPFIRCPRCKNSVNVIQKYCDECGQAIDWSKDGETE